MPDIIEYNFGFGDNLIISSADSMEDIVERFKSWQIFCTNCRRLVKDVNGPAHLIVVDDKTVLCGTCAERFL